ncbi:MAG: hemolysin III family protein [Gammaproteobacteria bacterium]|nr:hemolysin III family protein [Gammaproteobacteria bacterium]
MTFARDNDRCGHQAQTQTREEEALNSGLHGLAALGALAAGRHLLEGLTGPAVQTLSVATYITTLVLLLSTSAIYHALPIGRRKDLFQMLDRAAIYLLLAGTYTPIGLLMEKGRLGTDLCGIEWVLAGVGVASALLGRRRFLALSAWLYQVMGWLTALGMRQLLANAGPTVVWGLALGGISYIIGVLFLIRDHRPYFHPVSHLLVVIGATLQFGAISLFLGEAPH